MRADWFVRKQPIPPQASVKVVSGQWIQVGDELASVKALPGSLVRVDVATAIGAAPRDLMRHVIRPVGSEVRRNQILAMTNTFGYPLTAVSPEDGTVAQVSRSLGSIYVRKWVGIPSSDVRLDLTHRDSVSRSILTDLLGKSISALGLAKPSVVVKEYNVHEGEYVRRGQTVAVTSLTRPGMAEEVITPVGSPCTGIVKTIDKENAAVVIASREVTSVAALYPGRVLSIAPDSIEVAVEAMRFTGSYGIGSIAVGQVAVDQPPSAGCIWIVPRRISLGELEQARTARVAGVWAASASHRDLEAFAGPGRVRSVTSAWNGPVIALSEGFGDLLMATDTESDIRALNGRQAILNGATHLRAGAVRPELLIPQTSGTAECIEPSTESLGAPTAMTEGPREDLNQGMRVRGAWGHRQGWIGTVVSSPRPSVMANGVAAHVVAVCWDNGRTDDVPVRNLTALGGRESSRA